MDVYWLQQNQFEVPANDYWLGRAEVVRASRLRFPKRRLDWRLGRWTAKRAVAAYLGLGRDNDVLARIELRPEPLGAPQVFIDGRPGEVVLSLSHSHGHAFVAVAERGVALGCDLEFVEPRTAVFIETFFSPEEIGWVNAASEEDRPRHATLIWTAKESVLKALRVGLRTDTRSLQVAPPKHAIQEGWQRIKVRLEQKVFQGWYHEVGGSIRTVAADRLVLIPRPPESRTTPRELTEVEFNRRLDA